MFTLLSILLIGVGFCYATNCYEIQQSQMSSLDDRMTHMLNSFYTSLPQNAVPAVASGPGSDYNPYIHPHPYPYPYPIPPLNIYGPPPVLYTPPPLPIKPATKPPTFYNTDQREHNADYSWAGYYDNLPQHHEYERISYPFFATYQMPRSPYPPPLMPPFPISSQYAMPCSPSPPPHSYPSWEYAPYIPEYITHNYASPPPIPPFAYPTPPRLYPQLYHTPTEGSPPHIF